MKKQHKPSIIDAIWLNTLIPSDQENDSCWIWTGTVTNGGYGIIGSGGKYHMCHRATYEYAYGAIPDDLVVRHICNETRCVRPEHLVLGTTQQNIQDKMMNKRNIPNLERSPKFRANKKYFTEMDLRFWSKVMIPENRDDCWIWDAVLSHKGYGQFKFENKMVAAHRVSYILSYGEIPDGLFVCHTCDNRKCVNPSHLWLGTNQDNINDREAKGRNKTHFTEGHKITIKYSDEQCLPIFDLAKQGLSHSEIAKIIGMSRQQVQRILSGKRRSYLRPSDTDGGTV